MLQILARKMQHCGMMKSKIQLNMLDGVDESAAQNIVQAKGRELLAAVNAHPSGNAVLWTDKVVLSIHTAASAALLGLILEPGNTHLFLAMPPDGELARSLRDDTKDMREI
jgi:hypothetical protein